METKYRKLTKAEIGLLEGNGCLSPDWNCVEVAAEGFDARYMRNARLAGNIKIGANTAQPSGVYDGLLVDCTLGDKVLIRGIQGAIKNYDIANGVHIENVGAITCDGLGNFGNGVEVKAVNEAGGREVTIFDGLSAQFAYMTAMYRQSATLTAALKKVALTQCARANTGRGRIGEGALVAGCGKLHNVDVGPYARIGGAATLRNGTVNSSKQSPASVGSGVRAYDFIISEGAKVDNGAILERCFVGENCRIDRYFSATDCLFFANSDVANGEAYSVFAGPFTVSHHRSSLLIAGYFSFFNAGSGSNQSNHLFKTGAVHQGIHERGCKFASNAYVMLPAREGAFSMVMGRHTSHHDTQHFPYSYLVEEGGKTFLIPGANLRSFGTARDFAKWPARDKRTIGRDRINHNEYNPYIGEKLLSAIEICERLAEKEGADIHTYNRIKIKDALLKRGLGLYRMALSALLGNLISGNDAPAEHASPHWADMAGMFAPTDEIERLLVKIETGETYNLSAVEKELGRIHESYGSFAKAWALSVLERSLGHKPSPKEIAKAVREGEESAAAIAAMRREDSGRDGERVMQTGYGIDFPDTAASDFENVRKAQRGE